MMNAVAKMLTGFLNAMPFALGAKTSLQANPFFAGLSLSLLR
jgi:hypothetical protein